MAYTRDKILIRQLGSQNNAEVNQASSYLYASHFGYIQKFVVENNGTTYDAEDVWQDTMLAFRQQLLSKKFTEDKLQCKLTTYLYAIARNIWFKALRKGKKVTTITDYHKNTIPKKEEIWSQMVNTERKNKLKLLLNQLHPDSKKVLMLFYFRKWSVESIAREMGYASEQVAKNKLCKAKKKLKALFMQQYNKHDF